MPAAWLSTVSPAAAARKKTIESRMKTPVRRVWRADFAETAGRPNLVPACSVKPIAARPVSSSATARPAIVTRKPNAALAQPNSGAAIIAPAG